MVELIELVMVVYVLAREINALIVGWWSCIARNDIFSLKWRYYGLKRDIMDYSRTLIYFVCYSITSCQMINVYRGEIMDIGQIYPTHWCHWNMQMQLSQ